MSDTNSWPFSDKSLAVALMVVARYLAVNDARFVAHVEHSIEKAKETGLKEPDLAFLRTILASLKAAGG